MQNMLLKRSYTILVDGIIAGTEIQGLKTLPGFNSMSNVIVSHFIPIYNDCLIHNELNTAFDCEGVIPLVFYYYIRADLVCLPNLNSSL